MAENITSKRKNHFTDQFRNFSNEFLSKRYSSKMIAIVFEEGKASYDISTMYERYLGRYLNEEFNGKPTETASWCRSLKYELQKHDKKYFSQYLKLKEKIRKFRRNINLKGNVKFRLGREIKSIFKSREKELETLQNAAVDLFLKATKSLVDIFGLYSDGKLVARFLKKETLIFECRERISVHLKSIYSKLQAIEKSIESSPSTSFGSELSFYEQLKLPSDDDLSSMVNFKERIKAGVGGEKDEGSKKREIGNFKRAIDSFFGSFTDHNYYKTALTPIVFQRTENDVKYKSIAAVFKEYFGPFFYKKRILSPTTKWCRNLYEELRKHGSKYEKKYKDICKKIKLYSASEGRTNDILDTSGAAKIFSDALENLQRIFLQSGKNLVKENVTRYYTDSFSTVYLNLKVIELRVRKFRKIQLDKGELRKQLIEQCS